MREGKARKISFSLHLKGLFLELPACEGEHAFTVLVEILRAQVFTSVLGCLF